MNKITRSLSLSILLKLVLILGLHSNVLAQSAGKHYKAGSKFFDLENYRAAIPHFEKALEMDPDNPKVLYKAGISYMSFDKEKSIDYLDRAYAINPKVNRELTYWLGRVYHINYLFDEAIEYFEIYQRGLNKREKERYEHVNHQIQQVKNAKKEIFNPKDVFVKNLGNTINTAYSEHSPVISSDYNYLLFTSRAENVTGGKEAADGEFFEDIFETRRIAGDMWEPTRVVKGKLNSEGHDASIQLFDKDTKMLLYRDDKQNNRDIMVSERQPDGSWGEPKSISDKVNTKDFESDAYITPDGKTLFFSTNHYSEQGDLDIYLVQKGRNGVWGTPKSLGNVINTPFDDDSPFLAKNGTLYFSSRGHNSMGGYDIFSSKYDSVARKWSTPVNLGAPINTPDDDTYYRLSPDGSYAYLSSYRIGGYGEKDIYTISYIKNLEMEGQVFTQADSSLLPSVEMVFYSTQADRRPVSFHDISTPKEARYSVNLLSGRTYEVHFMREGKQLAILEVETPMALEESVKVKHNFYLPVDGGVKAAVPKKMNNINAADYTSKDMFEVENLYFDTDSYELREEAIATLAFVAKVLKKNPKMVVGLEGHTDSRAGTDYNMALSRSRVDAVYKYLLQLGVPQSQIRKVSFGQAKPTAPNTNEYNMQLNRRVEIKVIREEEQN